VERKLVLFLVIFLDLLGLPGILFADKGGIDFKFTQFTLEQGLSQVSVRSIIKDRNGFMWLGTQDGLNKYDGYDVTVYKHRMGDATSLSGNNIRVIIEDREDGILWIGTQSTGISKFDPVEETFTHYRHESSAPDSLSHDEIFSLYQDRDGLLWIGTWGGGLNKFDKKTGTFIHYKHEPDNRDSLSSNIVRVIFEDRNGIMWIGTYGGGLNKFNREKEQFTAYRHNPDDPNSLSNDRVMAIFEDKEGILWIGTDRGGLNAFNRETGVFSRYRHNLKDPGSLSHDRIRTIYEDTSGILWIGTFGGGINIFNRETRKFISIKSDDQMTTSLIDNQVLCIFEDDTRLIWIGTNRGGISRYDPLQKGFLHFNHHPVKQNSLSSSNVRAFVQDSEGILWIGTDAGGLNKFDRKHNRFIHYKHDPDKPGSLAHDRVYALYEDRKGILWVGTFGGGLSRFDRGKERFIHYQHNPENPRSISANQVRSICEDQTGVLWVGTWNGGLDKFDREKEVFHHYKHNPDNHHSLSRNYITNLYLDRSRTLWVSTWGGGINKYNRAADNFVRYLHEANNPNSLSSNNVFAIHEDHTGMLWVATDGMGLNKFNRKENKWTCYSTEHGLLNETIYGILEDEKGNLWLSTNKGLSMFNPAINGFKNYSVHDGLQSNEFNAGAYYKSQQGEMFFGGVNGFNAFYPREIKDNPYIPPVFIIGFRLFNRSLKFPKAFPNLEEIKLSYKDNFISFEFVALNYRVPEENQYAYKLEGFDLDWIKCGNKRSASYTNLNGGDYVFRVIASNNDGKWNSNGASIRLFITPPFWKTWWFQVLAIMLIFFSIYVVIRLRTINIRKRNRQLQVMNIQLNEQINERKQAEKALRASEKKYRKIIEDSIDVLYQADMSGKLMMVSPSGVKLSGYDSVEQMLGKDIAKDFYYNPKDRLVFLSELYKNGKVVNFEITLKRRDGTPLVVETCSHFTYNGDGKVIGVEGIIHDMTEKKRIEEEKQKLQEQLLNARKMEAVGTLAGGMAHEFNNLMAIITGYCEMLLDDLGHDSQMRNQVQTIFTTAIRCAELTGQLLSFSRKQMLNLKTVNLNRLIANMTDDICQAMGDKVKQVVKLDVNSVLVKVDPELMTRAIMGIVENSRDAMPGGGVLTIQTIIVEFHSVEGKVLPLERKGKFVCLSIADTGVGMDKDILPYIFEPFFTTKEVGEGTGLDLSFVYGTVAQHNGWIDVTSTPGKGTTMKLYLPISDE
jgi:PAS domain S-box-containing protein